MATGIRDEEGKFSSFEKPLLLHTGFQLVCRSSVAAGCDKVNVEEQMK